MDRTAAQVERQRHRRRDGRYREFNPCEICGRSAGADYCSLPRAGAHGLVLCGRPACTSEAARRWPEYA